MAILCARLGGRLLAHVQTWRPYTLWYAGLLGLAGAGLIGENPPVPRLILAWAVPTLGWVGGHYLGDFFDRHLDAISKPHRPIPSGRLTPESALVCGVECLLAVAALAVAGGPTTSVVAVLAVAGIIAYGWVLKARGLSGNLTRGALGGLALTFGVFAAAPAGAGIVDVVVAMRVAALVLAVWAHDTSSNLVGTLRDLDGDRDGGYRTVPVRHGAWAASRSALRLYALFVAAAVVGGLLPARDTSVVARVQYVVVLAVALSFGIRALRIVLDRRVRIRTVDGLRAHELLVLERIGLAGAIITLGLGPLAAAALVAPMLAATWWTQVRMRATHELGPPSGVDGVRGAVMSSPHLIRLRGSTVNFPFIDEVGRAIAAGAENLFGRQRSDGAFTDNPPASVLGTAGAITALHAADPAGSATLIAGGARWLLDHQLTDGGWGGVIGADSEAVATSVATAALRIVDPGGTTTAVAAGRRRLAELGGVAAVADRAVAHLCQQFLHLADIGDGPLRRLPLPVVLADRVRRQRISFRTAPFVGLALLQTRTMPGGPVQRWLTRSAQPRALGLLEAIHEHEGRTGDFSEDPWPAALVCLGLARAELAPHLVEAIAGFLRRSVRLDGSWDAVANLDLTRSAFATTGLVAAGYGDDPRLRSTRELFHRCQQREPFEVFDCPAGGWSYSGPRGWPVTLESAEILSALAGFPDCDADDRLRSGIEWLLRRQDRAGSWSLWVRDTKLPNDGPCPAITAQAVVALLDAGHRPSHPAIAAAVQWLLRHQHADGTYENKWYRDFTTGTTVVLDALARAGQAGHPAVGSARDWLLRTQRPDGSWGPGDGSAGSVEETAWAVHALLAAPGIFGGEAARRGVAWLLSAQRPDGSWAARRICNYIRHYMRYPNGAIAQGLALRALGAYRQHAVAHAGVTAPDSTGWRSTMRSAPVRPGISRKDSVSPDVVVCGGGVGGLACGHALSRLGLTVTILERAATPAAIAKGELLQPEAVAILADWGLLPALRTAGVAAANRLTIRDPAGRALLNLDYAELPGQFREILCTTYPTVLTVLADTLPDTEMVTLRRSVLVEEALRDERGRVVGVHCVQNGRHEELRARLVVAADGLSSRLRRSAGLAVHRLDYDHRLVAFELAGVAVDAEICAYSSNRGLRLVYPLPGGRCRVYVQVRPDELRGQSSTELTAWCEGILAELPALAPLADAVRESLRHRQILAVHRQRAARMSVPGLALVGEAAHAVHPMAAQGMNSSLADAHTLAEVIGAAGAEAGDAREWDQALHSYDEARRARLDHIATVSHNAARMLTSTGGLAHLVGRRMMRNTAANPRLLRLSTANLSGVAPRPLTTLDRLYQLGVLIDPKPDCEPVAAAESHDHETTVADAASLADVLDLSMNETPLPPPSSVRAVATDALRRLHRYPDHTTGTLLAALATRLDLPPERILVGPGSAGLCQHLLQALGAAAGPARSEVVHAELSFEAYPLLIANAGARPVAVPLDGYRHDLKAMAAAVNGHTRAVLVCSPNNPTGAAVHSGELAELIDRLPPEVTVILDEAYREFVTDPDAPDGLELARRHDNLCVLRTFSKAYGLAALRIGYAVAPAQVVAAARLVGMVFFPNSAGQAAAVESLRPGVEAEVTVRCAEIARERDRTAEALRATGFLVPPSQANFVFMAVGEHAVDVAQMCREAGVLVRAYPGHGVRVTISTRPDNERFLALARTISAGIPTA